MIVERMRERLCAVRLYADHAPHLSTELQVYAEELERSHEELDRLLRERFIVTAQDEGLTAYEALFGPIRTDEPIQKRRELLLLRLSLKDGDFTPAGIRKALDSLGVEYELSEYPHLQKLNISVTSDHSALEQAYIRRETAKMIPAHLEYQITFNTLTWGQLDALDRTFAAIDSENLTWAQIDARTC